LKKMKKHLFLLSLILLVAGPPDIHATDDWNQWAGPGRDFNVPNTGLAESWPENGPPEIWSRELGVGNSAVVVRDGLLYTIYRKLDAEGKPEGNERVVALNAHDGSTAWEYEYHSIALEGQTLYNDDPGPHSTPLVQGDRIFTLGFAGQFICLDRKTGDLIWKHDLVSELEAEVSYFGFTAAPLAHGGLVVIPASGEQCGLVAFDTAKGDVVWKSPPASFSYTSPFVLQYGGRDYLVHQSRDRVDGIDPQTGKQAWKYEYKKGEYANVPTPVDLGGGKLLISGQGISGVELIELSGEGDGIKTTKIWNNQKVSFWYSNAVLSGEYVYGGKDIYYSINWKTSERGLAERGYEHANLVMAGDLGILLDNKGVLHLVKPTGTGLGIISKFQLFENEAWTVPTIQGTRMYVRNRKIIVARELGKSALVASDVPREKHP
jgi:outer membrane protein assembly factor BamB